jgi:hypothetical protein
VFGMQCTCTAASSDSPGSLCWTSAGPDGPASQHSTAWVELLMCVSSACGSQDANKRRLSCSHCTAGSGLVVTGITALGGPAPRTCRKALSEALALSVLAMRSCTAATCCFKLDSWDSSRWRSPCSSRKGAPQDCFASGCHACGDAVALLCFSESQQ